jgi:hypothetical protein
MGDGWIKLFRRFLEWEWYDQTPMVRLFLHLLLKANYEDKKWHGIVIKRGQLVTSFTNLSAETGLSIQVVRSCLDKLQSTGEVNKQSTSQYTIITVCKFADYQQVEESEQQTNNKPTTSEQQTSNKRVTNNQQQHKNIRNKEIKNNNIDTNVSTSVETDPPIDFVGLLDFWNKTMESANAVIPKIKSLSERRKGFVKARVREFNKRAVFEVISKAGTSDFLNGKNQRGWVADFDWIFRPNNFPKVLEGIYDNRPNTQINGNNRTSTYQEQRAAELTKLAGDYSAIIARRLAEDEARH